MDNSSVAAEAAPAMHREWSTNPAHIVVSAAAGAVLLLLALAASADLLNWPGLDAAGVLLVGGASVVLLAVAAVDVVLRPRLSADAEGITVRTVTGRRRVPWASAAVHAVQRRRFGRSVHTLEVDDGERLLVLGRRELGTSPQAVADEITRLRTAPPPA